MSVVFIGFDVGYCRALFASMVVGGSMNILWMARLTLVLSFERAIALIERLAQGVGVFAGAAGFGVIVITIL